MFTKLLLLCFTLFCATPTFANCDVAEKSFLRGRELYQRKLYLLSLQEFSLAQKFSCPQWESPASWGYLLTLTELNEKDEAFRLATQTYPSRLSSEYQKKLKVYQSYHFGINPESEEHKRVEQFKQWQDSLPAQKSPAVAATLSALLPGSGQFYVGSWQSGALAMVLNALFLSATLELQHKDLPTTALASGLVFSIAYVGNILNAAESAKIYSQNYYEADIEKERQKRLPELDL